MKNGKLAKRFASLCRLLLFSFYVSNAWAEITLVPHHAIYKVKIRVLGGEMRSGLEISGPDYRVASEVSPKGIARLITRGTIRENSHFSIVNGHVRPTLYSSSDTLSKNGHEIQMTFNWDANVAVGDRDGLPYEASLEDNVIDRASLQYTLMYDLSNNQLQAEYILIEADGLKRLAVTTKGRKSVDVPYGQYNVIGISHRAESSSRETTLWCAPTLGYLPVVIEQHRNGKMLGKIVLVDYQRSATQALTDLEHPDNERRK